MIGLIGKKVGMTRLFGQDGESIPVTAILAGPCYVVQVKTNGKEGYQSVQLGAFEQRKKRVKKPQIGHFSKAGLEPKAKLAEFRVKNVDLYQSGQVLKVDIFQKGDRVKVTGISKGKGFAGGVKRWGFHGGPKTHGQSDRHRAPGSIGQSSWPSRVWKGMKMSGRMGSDRVTIPNLEVVKVDLERDILILKGPVPGARNGYLLIQRTTELTEFPVAPEPEIEETAKKETGQKRPKKTKTNVAAAPMAASEKESVKEDATFPAAEASDEIPADGQKESGETPDAQEEEIPREQETSLDPEVGEKKE